MDVFISIANVLLWVLAIYLLGISLYMLLITLGAWLYRARSGSGNDHLRMAIVVPAHDEEAGIATTVRELLSVDYPDQAFQVFVVADNCSDATADRAREAGAESFARVDEEKRGKGQALDWFLRGQRERLQDFDAVVFVDADMYVDKNFLLGLNRCLSDPEVQVVQGQYTISNPTASWRAALGYMSFAYVNHVRLAGRCFWKGTADLKGSGMAFRRDLILEKGWPAHTIVEDVEFGKQLLLEGIRVHYVPNAIVTSDIPSETRQAAVQQSRWEGGNWYLLRAYFPKNLRSLFTRPSLGMLDALIDLCVPPLSLVVALSIVGGIASVWLDVPFLLFIAPIFCFGFAVLTGLIQLRAPAKTWLYLATIPAFIVWKLVLFAGILSRRGPTEWERTPRDSEIEKKPEQ